jgi:hypothetical protein
MWEMPALSTVNECSMGILDKTPHFSSEDSTNEQFMEKMLALKEGSSLSYLLEVVFRLPAVAHCMAMTPRAIFRAHGTFPPILERTVPSARRFVIRAWYSLQRGLLFLLYDVFVHWHFLILLIFKVQGAAVTKTQFYKVGRESSLGQFAPVADRILNLVQKRLAEWF